MDYRPLLEEFAEWLRDDVFHYCDRWNRPRPNWIKGLSYPQALQKFQTWVQICFANCHPEHPETLCVSGTITPRLEETFEGTETEAAFWLGRFYEQHRRIRPIPLYSEKELDAMPREVLIQLMYSFPFRTPTLGGTLNLDDKYLKKEILGYQEILGIGESVLVRELDIGDAVVIPIKRIANRSDIVVAYIQNIEIGPDPRIMAYWTPGNPIHSLFKIAVLPIEEIQGNTRVKIDSQIYIPEFYPQQRIFRLK